ncbi:MAG: type II toxin-antitoxin system VapC family toxin [Beijerinckiaceae bacterium]
MFVDTSAIVALLRGEEKAADIADALQPARLGIVLQRQTVRQTQSCGLHEPCGVKERNGPILFAGDDFAKTDLNRYVSD